MRVERTKARAGVRTTNRLATCGFCLLWACGSDSEPQQTSGARSDAGPRERKPDDAGHTATAPSFERSDAGKSAAANGDDAGQVTAAASGGDQPSAADGGAGSDDKFSFFVASFAALQRLSNSENGFGGDLRYGEADGLSGADKICREIAEASSPGAGAKSWRAFLSVTKGPDGKPVHAIDRIGNGPWYDRLGRLLAESRDDLLHVRPQGGDPAIVDDFPNEDGVPNHAPDGVTQVDNHDVLTGTNDQGQLFNSDWKYTCHDWTSSTGSDGTPRVGHSWPRSGTAVRRNAGGAGGANGGGNMPEMPGMRRTPRQSAGGSGGPGNPNEGNMGRSNSSDNWMSALNEAGCAAGASLVEMGGPKRDNPTVGSGGGYGAIYCFVHTP